MTKPKDPPFSTLQFYSTAQYPCSYLPGKMARSQVATPSHLITTEIYSNLVKMGFRRSGLFNYKPHCDHCDQCKPYRVDATHFTASRSQKRTYKKWQHLKPKMQHLHFEQEHFELYLKYQSYRHQFGGMDDDNQEQYSDFLVKSNVKSQLIAFRDETNDLKMVSIIDVLQDGLSSVYTFFDPTAPSGLGIFSILWQIKLCQALNLPYLYLGYYIKDSKKMNYKNKFLPAQIYQNTQWVNFDKKYA